MGKLPMVTQETVKLHTEGSTSRHPADDRIRLRHAPSRWEISCGCFRSMHRRPRRMVRVPANQLCRIRSSAVRRQTQFCTINLLAPLGTKLEVFQFVMKQICQAAEALGIAIVRGHTGMYGSVSELVGVATVYGSVQLEKLITPANAKPGDIVMCTKPLGLETLTNFALTHSQQAQKLFGVKQQQQLSSQVHLQSCVEEALQLAAVGGVHAMHDATEGGFVAALNELAGASNVGFKVDWGRIPVSKEAYALQSTSNFQTNNCLPCLQQAPFWRRLIPRQRKKSKPR